MIIGSYTRYVGRVPVAVEPSTARTATDGTDPHTAPTRPRIPSVQDGRLRALDGLRLLCALAVALFHYLAIEEAAAAWGKDAERIFPDAGVIAAYGWLGVEVFFMISGFAICMSCWGRTLGDFFRSRVTRLYPAYWAAVLLTAAAVALAPTVAVARSFPDVLVNLTMLQDPFGVPRVDGAYWSLWAEMRFYLLFAIVVHGGLTYRRVVAFCILWTALAAVATQADSRLLQVVVMPEHAPFFIVGLGLYLLHRFGHQPMTWLLMAVNAPLAYHFALARMNYESRALSDSLSAAVVGVVLVLAAALMVAIVRGRLDWVRWRWVTYAGALTYPFYLLHDRIGRVLIHWLYQDAGLSAYVTLPLTLTVILAMAWCVHRWIERPLSRRLRSALTSPVSLRLDPPDLLSPAARPGRRGPSAGEATARTA